MTMTAKVTKASNRIRAAVIPGLIFALLPSVSRAQEPSAIGTFGYDAALLKAHKDVLVLKNENAAIVVAADYQARVMTSTAQGDGGRSYGWINHKLIATGNDRPGRNAVGGEDRVWFGPEFGKFSVFFAPGAELVAANIKVPAPISTEPFNLLSHDQSTATYGKTFQLQNQLGTVFTLEIERQLSVFSRAQVEKNLGLTLGAGVAAVGFQSHTTMKNAGRADWAKDTGLLSIWIIGAFPPSAKAVAVIPTKEPAATVASYWSEVGKDRLAVTDFTVFYKADGNHLHKIGLPAKHATPFFGSYDATRGVLTIIHYSFHDQADYVNSLWDINAPPYAGEAINVFNDGPMDNGGPFGPFYELESSSSAKPLKRGESQAHTHATYHFEGDQAQLNAIALKTLGVSLTEISQALPQ